MTAIFLRELRENFKWAVVIFGVLSALVYKQLRLADPHFMTQLSEITMVVAPLAGLLLGVAQSLFETRPDNWAFVVHRPVPRLAIYLAKCAAGLLLLYSALILPCLLAAMWAARPGQLLMPFQPRMMLPHLADVLTAGCYYFTGMLLTLRRARWYGSRLLPLGLALIASLIVIIAEHFWQAVLAAVAIQAVCAVAAWGAFANHGAAPGGLAPRASLGAMIYPGAMAVAVFLVALSTLLLRPGGRWQYYQVDRDGNLVRVTQTLERGHRQWTITDPAGTPLPQYEGIDLDEPVNANLFVRFGAPLVDDDAVPWPLTVLHVWQGYRSETPGVVALRAVAPPGVKLRHAPLYDVQDRIIKLYDPVTRTIAGVVGPAGISQDPLSPVEPFPGKPLNLFSTGNRHALAFESVVYWIELDHKRVRPIFAPPAGDAVFSAAEIGMQTDPRIVVATTRRLHLLRPTGEVQFSVPLGLDRSAYAFSPALLSNGHLIVHAHPIPSRQDLQLQVFEYSPGGELVRRTEPPKLREMNDPKLAETALFGALFPTAARSLCPAWILDNVLQIRSPQRPWLFDGFMLASAVVSAALAIGIARRRRLGMTRTVTWSLGALLLGPAAIACLLSLNEQPPSVVCSACGKSRPIRRRCCSECGAAPAGPPSDGREIFEPADAFIATA